MSSEAVSIRATELGKCYHMYARPSDRLKQFVAPKLRSVLGRPSRDYFREFWALSSVSMEVRRGETVGIIGRNGSGKSTLLQMICGTLTPTRGSVEVFGRVAALLELGAGFNPDYTGRENVYMNCSVLGLSRAEIDERFDDIVAFSELGEFIEQPVKSYSSGMFARLAFSAAVHVDPDILIVDEALSVGDFAFQYKCIKRLKEIAAAGATVLFVTHDIEQVQKLCTRALYLRQGHSVFFGDAREACERYLAEVRVGESERPSAKAATPQEREVEASDFDAFAQRVAEFRRGDRVEGEILHISVNHQDEGEPTIAFDDDVEVRITFRLKQPMHRPVLALYVTDQSGQMIIGTNSTNEKVDLQACEIGTPHVMSVSFRNGLREGPFAFQVFLADVGSTGDTHYVDYLELAAPFRSVRRDTSTRWAWFTPPFTTTLEMLTRQPA